MQLQQQQLPLDSHQQQPKLEYLLFFLALLPIVRLLLELQPLPKPTPVLVPLPKLAPLLMLMLQLVLKPMLGPQHQLELQPIIAYQPGLQLEPAVQLKAITLPGQQLMDQQLRLIDRLAEPQQLEFLVIELMQLAHRQLEQLLLEHLNQQR